MPTVSERRNLFPGLLVVVACLTGSATSSVAAAEPNVFLTLRGEKLEGVPLSWSPDRVFLLVRDGRMVDFSPAEATNYGRAARNFSPASSAELRSALQSEFGTGFDVSGGGHYVVVHPRGQREQWTGRFEDLYRSFQGYFAARGLRPSEPQFPLVAVVLPNRDEFLRYARQEGVSSTTGLMGFYSIRSNRILMFDYTASHPGADWSVNAETIIHEATHQTAFNTGLHRRFADTPLWAIEGLGCLFEARGIWSQRPGSDIRDRMNSYRAQAFTNWSRRRPSGSLAEIVASDRLFKQSPEDAYAEAWALTFFLSETQPRKYAEYLQKLAALKPFAEYSPADRMHDFEAVFGRDWRMLEARFLRFMQEL